MLADAAGWQQGILGHSDSQLKSACSQHAGAEPLVAQSDKLAWWNKDISALYSWRSVMILALTELVSQSLPRLTVMWILTQPAHDTYSRANLFQCACSVSGFLTVVKQMHVVDSLGTVFP